MACGVRTLYCARHPSKILVPAGATFDAAAQNEENDLTALNLTKCAPNHLDIEKRIVYLPITKEDRERGYKE